MPEIQKIQLRNDDNILLRSFRNIFKLWISTLSHGIEFQISSVGLRTFDEVSVSVVRFQRGLRLVIEVFGLHWLRLYRSMQRWEKALALFMSKKSLLYS